MIKKILSTIGNEVPDDFPFQHYENIHVNIVPQKDLNYNIWIEFAGSWNSIAYKFITLAENDEVFTNSIHQFGCTPVPKERIIQEQSLFSFFVNAQSLIESLGYAMYLLGALNQPKNFPIKQEIITNLSPEITRDKFKKVYPTELITEEFDILISSNEFRELKKIRNVLIHRTMPGRNTSVIIGCGDEKSDTNWKYENLKIDDQFTSIRRIRLAKLFIKTLKALDEFTQNKFKIS